MDVPFYQVDAFSERAFGGNPAAVMLLDRFPDDALMHAIAAENNLSETAFVVRRDEPDVFDLRWLTPTIEIPLCGHATLAAAHVLFEHERQAGSAVAFDTRSGRLPVCRENDGSLRLDFPADPPRQLERPVTLAPALGCEPKEVWAARYLLAIFETEDEVRKLAPDLRALEPIARDALDGARGNLICSAPGSGEFDCVSRFFAPGSGVAEDPVTGSAHCAIAPYFSERLGKPELRCFQAYPGRGGVVRTSVRGDRVHLCGHAVTVLSGTFHLPDEALAQPEMGSGRSARSTRVARKR